ncbi:MAG: sulfotransferase domain-containing protein, partial [Geminicoccales bacterium]
MHGPWQEAMAHRLEAMLLWLPQKQHKAIARWLRGRAEFAKLQRADGVVVSWGKSGRTWLRVMLSRFYQLAHDLPEGQMLEFDNLHRTAPGVPRVLFSHGNYVRDYTHSWDSKAPFYHKKVVLLARDPRDVAVSQYFQWKYRMRPVKKMLNDYPPHGSDVPIYEFMMDAKVGLPRIIAFLEEWERELPRVREAMVVRYEDMRADPEGALRRVLAFLGTPGAERQIAEAAAYASYDNMKKLEQEKVYRLSGSRLAPGDQANPQSY